MWKWIKKFGVPQSIYADHRNAYICSDKDGKASVVVGVTKDLTDKYNAVELVRAAAGVLGGQGGGGRADMAQAVRFRCFQNK